MDMDQAQEIDRLTKENAELRKELWHQWEANHYEHCIPDGLNQRQFASPSHQANCNWPVPKILVEK